MRTIRNKKPHNEILDYTMEEFKGIEIEPADRSVGISEDFCLWGIDDNNNQVEMHFGVEEFHKLCQEIKKIKWN